MSHNTKPPCHHSEVIRRGERRMELIEAPGVDVKQSDTQTDADQLQPENKDLYPFILLYTLSAMRK